MHNNNDFGDYIGVESCVDFRPNLVEITSNTTIIPRRRQRRSDAAEKKFPPSIPWLARTENLPSHMPWVMKKYSTSDGRLVIKEEKVKHHEYFKAHRSNGRLVLNLVPLEDVVEEHGDTENEGEIINGSADEGIIESNKYNGIEVNPCGGHGVAVVVAGFTPPLHI